VRTFRRAVRHRNSSFSIERFAMNVLVVDGGNNIESIVVPTELPDLLP
jgi:hypothetical protein